MNAFLRFVLRLLKRLAIVAAILAALVAIFYLLVSSGYLDALKPWNVQSYLEGSRLGLKRNIHDVPECKVTRYRHYREGPDFVDEHKLKFKTGFSKKAIAAMDSLSRTDDHKSLSGWYHVTSEGNDGYAYYFYDIVNDCRDSVVFFPVQRRGKIVYKWTTRTSSYQYERKQQRLKEREQRRKGPRCYDKCFKH